MIHKRTCLLIIPALALLGCRSLDPHAYPTAAEWDKSHRGEKPIRHSVELVEPNAPAPRWYLKIDPIWWLGNSAEPVPPASYRPGAKTRVLTWYMRNPFHNFDYYVIGVADHEIVRSGSYPGEVMNPEGGWNSAWSAYGWLRLPFVSYEGWRFRFYLGWRERGDFGFKLNLKRAQSPETR